MVAREKSRLYRITESTLVPVEEANFDRERELQDTIEKNLEELFSFKFIASEHKTAHGRPDTLALSAQRHPVIIEYKKAHSHSTLNQVLDYVNWVRTNQDRFEILAQNTLGLQEPLDWSKIRALCISPHFDPRDIRAANEATNDRTSIEFWRYQLFAHRHLSLTPMNRTAILEDKRLLNDAMVRVPRTASEEHPDDPNESSEAVDPGKQPVTQDGSNIFHKRFGFPDRVWTYHDLDGEIHGWACRWDRASGKEVRYAWKTDAAKGRNIAFNRPQGGQRVLWRLPELLENQQAEKPEIVIVTEGEPAAEMLVNAGFVATTNGASTSVGSVRLDPLQGMKVVLWPDNDDAGIKKWCKSMVEALAGFASQTLIIKPDKSAPAGWDAGDAEGWDHGRFISHMLKHKVRPYDVFSAGKGNVPPKELDTLAEDGNDGIKVLGVNGMNVVLMSKMMGRVVEIAPRSWHPNLLVGIAPISYWMKYAPADKRSSNTVTQQIVRTAQDVITRKARTLGQFDTKNVRGRGVWRDKGRIVINTGDRIIDQEGREHTLDDWKSQYAYIKEQVIDGYDAKPLGDEQSRSLFSLVRYLPFRTENDGLLLLGWLVCAMVSGALKWRPHLWMTSSRGRGKTWIKDEILTRLTGDNNISFYTSGSSIAGIVSEIEYSSLPVIYEEAGSHNKKEAETMEAMMSMSGIASKDGQRIVKGTRTGGSRTSAVTACMMFISRAKMWLSTAEESRITQLSLTDPGLTREDRAAEIKRSQEVVNPRVEKLLTEEYCSRFRARVWRNAAVVSENSGVFSDYMARATNDHRMGDQIGALLAGAYLLNATDVLTESMAERWLDEVGFNIKNFINDHPEEPNEALEVLQTIMTKRVRGILGGDTTIGQLVESVISDQKQGITNTDTERHLSGFGVRIDASNDLAYLATNKPIWHQVLFGTRYQNTNVVDFLKRAPGYRSTRKVLKFSGASARVLSLPLNLLIDGASSSTARSSDKSSDANSTAGAIDDSNEFLSPAPIHPDPAPDDDLIPDFNDY